MASLQSVISMPQQEGTSRKMCVGKMGSVGVVAAAVATYNSNNGRGTIVLKALNEEVLAPSGNRPKGFWGFSRRLRLASKQKKLKASSESSSSTTPSQSLTDITQEIRTDLTCPSPRLNTDISNWTHPPTSAISDRTPTPATPSHGPSTSVKLFGSERHDSAPFMSPPPVKKVSCAKLSKKKVPKEPVQVVTAKKKSKESMTVSTAKKRKVVDTSSLQTPSATGPVVVPQSSIQTKPGLGKPPMKRLKQDEKDARQPKNKVSSKANLLKLSLDDLAKTATSLESSSATAASKDRTTPPSTNPTSAKQSKVCVAKDGTGPRTPEIPGTPQIQSVGTSLEKASAQTTSVSGPGGAQQVSPDPKEAAVATKASKVRNEKNDITQYLEKPKQPSKSTKPSTTREVAEAMCEMGSAKKSNAAAPKRTSSEMNNPATGNVSKTPRGKSTKTGRKSPAPPARKRQLVGSQDYKNQCVEQEERLKFLEQNHLPGTPVETRMGISASSQETGTVVADQELARMKLAAEHRANHEMLLKRIIHAAQFTVKALKKAETVGAVEVAEESFQESFRSYYEILDESLWRQTMEASTLADRQTWERQGSAIPTLQVSFPFYGVFDEVIACVDSIIQKAR